MRFFFFIAAALALPAAAQEIVQVSARPGGGKEPKSAPCFARELQ